MNSHDDHAMILVSQGIFRRSGVVIHTPD